MDGSTSRQQTKRQTLEGEARLLVDQGHSHGQYDEPWSVTVSHKVSSVYVSHA